MAELQWPEELPSGAPYPYRKKKGSHELIFPWLSWLAVLLVGMMMMTATTAMELSKMAAILKLVG